jgi:hypothetical protein
MAAAGRHALDPGNTYCSADSVRLLGELRAGGLKLACYTVRDPVSGEHGKPQYHATYDNTVLALMGESSAALFAAFVQMRAARSPEASSGLEAAVREVARANQALHDCTEDYPFEAGLMELDRAVKELVSVGGRAAEFMRAIASWPPEGASASFAPAGAGEPGR